MITSRPTFVLALTVFALIYSATFVVQNVSAQSRVQYPPSNYVPYTNSNSCHLGPRHCGAGNAWSLPGYGGQPSRLPTKTQRLIESNQRNHVINFSSHWQAPFNVLQNHGGSSSAVDYSTLRSRPSDVLDNLANVKLLPNVRSDSGYCGPNCDAYGYLGSSQSYLNNGATAPRYFDLHPRPATQSSQPTNSQTVNR